MALTGTSTTVMKEFHHQASGQRVRLTQGWDNDTPAYYAVDVKSGLHLAPDHLDHGKQQAQVFGPNLAQYKEASAVFADLVKAML